MKNKLIALAITLGVVLLISALIYGLYNATEVVAVVVFSSIIIFILYKMYEDILKALNKK